MGTSSTQDSTDGSLDSIKGFPYGSDGDANINRLVDRSVKGSQGLRIRGGDYNSLQDDKLEPLAVVGFSSKFPQEATTPEAFWKMLTEKRCAVTEWPKDRLNIDAFYHPDSSRPDTIPFRGGHFLTESLGSFDATFFSITPTEAAAMDPQHRFLLETAYRALENAGISMEKASGSKTSVHTGCFTDDYKLSLLKDMAMIPKYAATGVAVSMLAARLSWFFNFTGPCVNLDSACSSSMMAFDLACQGLRNGDTEMALVAGGNLALSLEVSLPLSLMNFFSKDSRSFSFDHRANGYGRGEGFGVIVIKRLADALRDGDTIRAVVRSTASNQDGRTPGITQPNKDAQELLIRETYKKAGLSLQATRYVEAHGTGTAIGDPIEAGAIGRAFRKHRSAEEPIYVGAVKSNIGHLEGASGVASIIKTIMILESGLIPPNANFEQLNPDIDADFLRIKVPICNTPWPTRGLRRASVSSFGFGGSNSHAILDDAYNYLRLRDLEGNHSTAHVPPSVELFKSFLSPSVLLPSTRALFQYPLDGYQSTPKPRLLVWSSADKDGLARLANVYSTHMSQLSSSLCTEEASIYLESLAYTLAARRSSLAWKSFAVATSISELQHLDAKLSKPVRSNVSPKLGYVFTGQGAQFAEMAKELFQFPAFQASIRRSEMYLDHFGCNWSLTGELTKKKNLSNVNEPEYSQVLCTVLQIAIVDLLRNFKVTPAAVVGHSSGEIAAAYCVGGISHRSACKVAYFRGKYAAKLAASDEYRGAMMSVGLSEDQFVPYVKEFERRFGRSDMVVACINSPRNITISGDEAQLYLLKSLLDQDSIFSRKLQVNVAYHSPQMNAVAEVYLASMRDLEPGDPGVAHSIMISSVTGTNVSLNEVQQSEYWVRNMTSPVRFSDALIQICALNAESSKKTLRANQTAVLVSDLLEIGPHSALQGPINDTLKKLGADISYSSTLVRSLPATETLLNSVGRLHCYGHSMDISKINDLSGKQAVLSDLPEYPFNHSRSYWHESRISKEGYRLRKHPRLDLLGSTVPDWNPLEARWRNFIRASEIPWIKDHCVTGALVYPAAGMIVMAVEAAKQLADENRHIIGYCIQDADFSSPLTISLEPEGVEVEVYVRPLRDLSEKNCFKAEFKVCANINGHWNENCRGIILVEYKATITEVDGGKEAMAKQSHYYQLYEQGRDNCDRKSCADTIYKQMENIGLAYGPTFQGLEKISYSTTGQAVGTVQTFQWVANNDTNHPQSHVIHPTTLDCFLQLMLVALSKGMEEAIPTMMPTRIGKLWISSLGISYPNATEVNAYAQAAFSSYRTASALLFALDKATGHLLLSMENAEATTVATRDASFQSGRDEKKMCYNMCWKPDPELLNPQQIQMYCEKSRPSRAPAGEFYENLDLVLIMFMSGALKALKEGKHQVSQPHLRQYSRWLNEQVDKFHSGDLPQRALSHPKWKSITEDAKYREELCNSIELTNQGKFFMRIGRNLLKMLQGHLDPLTFMFQDDSIPEFYREVNRHVICFEPLNRYLDLMCHKNPSPKILEIGAGTGATTDYILEALGAREQWSSGTLSCSQYVYTDISPAFFEAASERYRRYSEKLEFKVLDIENDPSKQGFELGTYDLIFAASVLHATKNLEVTMRNARMLLKPGGKLVIWEITQDVIRASFAFGLLPGWWLSQEDYRQHGPCVSTNRWNELMCRNGFTGVELEIPDYLDKGCHEYSILVSTAAEPIVGQAPTPPKSEAHCPETLIVITEDSASQMKFATRFKSRLIASNTSNDCAIVTLGQTFAVGDLGSRFCFLLTEIEKPLLSNIDKDNFDGLQHLLATAPGIIWVTNGGDNHENDPHLHLVDGLARVARTEFNKLIFVTISLENIDSDSEATLDKILGVFKNTFFGQSLDDFEPEYSEKDGILEINRIVEAGYLNKAVQVKTSSNQVRIEEFGSAPALALQVGSPGLLDSLYFSEDGTVAEPLAPGELEIKIQSAGVNFRDCLSALGQINDISFGSECAGNVSRVGAGCQLQPGDRVAAFFASGFKTYARGPEAFAMTIPDEMSYTEASAIPVIFVTAWHALCDVARIQRGESVLIHAGAGGTGQAAIQVAKLVGAEIYATVGSDDKKKLLMSTYDIPEDHILYSRNTSFAQGIMRLTNNNGVDVVLNSLSGESLVASWECIAKFGRFIEIGKHDINARSSLPMWQFRKAATFSSVDLYPLFEERPVIARNAFMTVMKLFAEKKLHMPQPFRVLGVSEIEEALRLLQSGRAPGKMAIEMRENEKVRMVINTKPEYYFSENSSYVIAGGLGGLGRSAARWMASRGARNLILLSRSGARSEAAVALIEELNAMGVHVEASPCDVTDADLLSTVLAGCAETMPPIRGCIQASMQLRDSIIENMTLEDWKQGIKPKVQGTWNLHTLLPRGMDFFICFSSASGIIGSGGTANYAAGNTYMDAFVEQRIIQGEKATSLDLGWMAAEGVAAESSFLSAGLAAVGYLIPISQAEFHALLDYHCDSRLDFATPTTCRAIIGLETPAAMRAKGLPEPHWMQRATFRHLRQMGLDGPSPNQSETAIDYAALFRDAVTVEDRAEIVLQGLVRKLSRALSIPPEDIDPSKPLYVYGVDSLLAVELRNYFAKEMGVDLAIFDIMNGSNFQAVSMTVASKSHVSHDS